jgi:hypothetical protein
MFSRILLRVAVAVTAIGASLYAQQADQRRASIRGGGGDRGKCTIEVVVDGVAEVDIRGDNASLRTLAGQPAQWRRFECSGPMPNNPGDFRFSGVDGRGRQTLVRDPRNGGVAVVRIEDPQGGSEGYTFDIEWSGGGYSSNRPDDRTVRRGRIPVARAVQVCQEWVKREAEERYRTRDIVFRSTDIDNNPGRNDWVVGTLDVRRGGRPETYGFSCSVNFDSGQVRSAQIDDNDRGQPRRGEGGGNAARAIGACQSAAEDRLRRDGYSRVEFVSIQADNRPGRNDSIVGVARAERRNRTDSFDVFCSVSLDNGTVRSVDIRRR